MAAILLGFMSNPPPYLNVKYFNNAGGFLLRSQRRLCGAMYRELLQRVISPKVFTWIKLHVHHSFLCSILFLNLFSPPRTFYEERVSVKELLSINRRKSLNTT